MSTPLLDGAERILTVCLGGLGDVITIGPALRSLRRAYPHAEIAVLCYPRASQAVPLLPWVDTVIVCEVGGSIGWPTDTRRARRTIDGVRHKAFDAALIFTRHGESPYVPGYISYLAGIPIRVGFSQEFGGAVLSHCLQPPPEETHPVDRHLQLLDAIGCPRDGSRLELEVSDHVQLFTDQRLRSQGLDPYVPFAILALDANTVSRYAWERTALTLIHEAGMPIVLVDAAHQIDRSALRGAGHREGRVVFFGRTSIAELTVLVRRAALIATNDLDLLPIAATFERPIIGLPGTELHSEQFALWNTTSHPADAGARAS